MFPTVVRSLIVADIAPVSYPSRHDHIFKGLRAVDLAAITSRSQADQQMQVYITDITTRFFTLQATEWITPTIGSVLDDVQAITSPSGEVIIGKFVESGCFFVAMEILLRSSAHRFVCLDPVDFDDT